MSTNDNQFGGRRYLRFKELTELGLAPKSRSTLTRWCEEGTFPKPIKLTERTIVWSVEELAQMLAERAAERG
jgi:predicted DNA-binding transcriptional regulator AlpA